MRSSKLPFSRPAGLGLESELEPHPMKLKHVVESQQFTVPLLM